MAVEKVLEDLLGEYHGAGFLMISLDELKNRYEKLNLNGSHIKKHRMEHLYQKFIGVLKIGFHFYIQTFLMKKIK